MAWHKDFQRDAAGKVPEDSITRRDPKLTKPFHTDLLTQDYLIYSMHQTLPRFCLTGD